jgi:MoaA/NifB/PqqE/SkfB family radical SAM enzyme
MCPRTTFLNEWESGDMPLSLYRKISEYFDRVENIHLQGWGEPLLHQDLFDMIRMAKEKDCNVSLTTNGMLLGPEISERLIKEGVAIIAISLAGATKKTHEMIRRWSNFDQLIDNIKALHGLKQKMKSKIPKITGSFLMTEMNIEELPAIVDLAKDIGINELVATNLDYAPTQIQYDLKAFSCNGVHGNNKKFVQAALEKAKKEKVPLRVYPLEMEDVVMCEMNPLGIVFLSHDGCVSPCVYLNMTKRGLLQRVFCGSSSEIQKVCFGNVGEHDFMDIWGKSDYRDFREKYHTRLNAAGTMYRHIGVDMASMETLKETEKTIGEALMKNPVPEECKTCYKAYGI